MHEPQRDGFGRRADDGAGHCPAHEGNTTAIASMQSAITTVKWFVGIMIPVSMAVIGTFQVNNSNALKEIDSGMKQVQQSINISLTNAAVIKTEVERLKDDMQRMEGDRHRR